MAHPLCLIYLYGVLSLSSLFFSAALALGLRELAGEDS